MTSVLHRRTHFRSNIVMKFLVDRFCSFRDIVRQLYITDHGNFGVVHALYHVTLSGGRGSKMKFLTFICDFYASTMTTKRCSKGSIPIVKRFLGCVIVAICCPCLLSNDN